MTPERAAELWPVMKAYSEGKEVEILTSDGWRNVDGPVFWTGTYRVKPEPRELWVYPEEFEKDRNPILAYVTPQYYSRSIKFREVIE